MVISKVRATQSLGGLGTTTSLLLPSRGRCGAAGAATRAGNLPGSLQSAAAVSCARGQRPEDYLLRSLALAPGTGAIVTRTSRRSPLERTGRAQGPQVGVTEQRVIGKLWGDVATTYLTRLTY